MNEPRVIERADQPYVGIRATVTMTTIPAIADRIPELFGWLAERGIAPAGAPFLKFNVIDMAADMELEAGIPTASAVAGEGEVFAGALPGGRFATATHVGHPAELVDATAALLAWADAQGLTWDKSAADAGERWGCRLEIYHTDPADEPDMNRWETELSFRLAD